MNVNDKIRMMREMNNWTQEYVADKLHMSLTSYAKLERGESRLHLDKLTKIAEVFQVNIADLLSLDKQGLIWLISGDGSGNYSNLNYYNTHNERDFQIERLTLQLQHKTEIIEQKDKLIEQLYAQISLLSK
mgnify:CR=1 FL=1